MIDKSLERNIHLLKEVAELWNEYSLIINKVVDSENEPEEQLEEEFLKLKAKLAYRSRLLKNYMGSDLDLGPGIIKVISMTPALDILHQDSPIIKSRVKSLWHEVFIALNKLSGTLRSQHEYVSGIGAMQSLIMKIKGSIIFRFAVLAVIAIVVICIGLIIKS